MQRDQKRQLFDFINNRQKTLNNVDKHVNYMVLREKDLQSDLDGLEGMAEAIWNAYVNRKPQDVRGKESLRKMLRDLQHIRQSLLNLIRVNDAELQRLRRSRRRLELEVMWKKLKAGIPPSELGDMAARLRGTHTPDTPDVQANAPSTASSGPERLSSPSDTDSDLETELSGSNLSPDDCRSVTLPC